MNESMKEKEKLEENSLIDKNEVKEKKEDDFDDFSIQGKIDFIDFKVNLSSKYFLNKDKETNQLIPSSIISFSHQLTHWMKYSFKGEKNFLKFMTSMNPLSSFYNYSNKFR